MGSFILGFSLLIALGIVAAVANAASNRKRAARMAAVESASEAPRSVDVRMDSLCDSEPNPAFRSDALLASLSTPVLPEARMIENGRSLPRFAMDSDPEYLGNPLSLDGAGLDDCGTMPSIAPPPRTGFESEPNVQQVTIPLGDGKKRKRSIPDWYEIAATQEALNNVVRLTSIPPGPADQV